MDAPSINAPWRPAHDAGRPTPARPARVQVFFGSAPAGAPADLVLLGERLNRVLTIVAQAGGAIERLDADVRARTMHVRLEYRVPAGADFDPFRA